MTQLLLIEDDLRLAALVVNYLQQQSFTVRHIARCKELAQLPSQSQFDLVICDLMLPDGNGFALFNVLSQRFNCPIIFLTALGDDEDQIKGLELGAIDYIVKPVDPKLLLARVKANLRKTQAHVAHQQIVIADLQLDGKARLAKLAGTALDLTSQEFDLLWLFAQHQGQPLSRETLFTAIVGREYNGLDRTVDARTMRLRKKINDLQVPGLTIQTVWGKGYLFSYTSAAVSA